MFLRVFIFINVLFSANAMAAVGKGHVSGKSRILPVLVQGYLCVLIPTKYLSTVLAAEFGC